MKNLMLAFVVQWFLTGTISNAAIKMEMVDYKDGKTVLEGQLFYDDSWTTARPAVVVVHQWMGPSDHEKESAQQLAKLGYVAFVADIYGKGVRPTSADEAGKLAAKYKSDIQLYRQRVKAALESVSKSKKVDAKKLVIIGYCFGGTGALEAARGGFPVVAAVSFHGGLATPLPENTKNVMAKLLVLHGAIDPFVSIKEVNGFIKEMNDAKADFQFIAYSGAVHAFTQKNAGGDVTKGTAYNEVADHRSWLAFKNFLNEVVPVGSF